MRLECVGGRKRFWEFVLKLFHDYRFVELARWKTPTLLCLGPPPSTWISFAFCQPQSSLFFIYRIAVLADVGSRSILAGTSLWCSSSSRVSSLPIRQNTNQSPRYLSLLGWPASGPSSSPRWY